jgi:hypothetical protein
MPRAAETPDVVSNSAEVARLCLQGAGIPPAPTDAKEHNMPKYFLSIVEAEAAYAEAGTANFDEIMQGHSEFGQAVKDAGATVLSGEALQPTPTAVFLRGTRTAGVSAVDNPLPEAKEVIGGYYLIEAADDEQALALAKLCPAPFGYIEMRPIWEFS